MNHLPSGLPTGLATFTLLAGAILLGVVPAGSAVTATEPVLFGMSASAVSAQSSAGVKPDYGTFWIGPWTLSSGWGGPDSQMASLKSAGVTPAIHFYYWGDDITPTCVENGCWSSLHNTQKTRAGWETLGTQLGEHLTAKMGGEPVVIFLESEFNKGGISTYEPFDGYMADMANKIHAGYPNAIVVLGYGNWDNSKWGNFDRAAAASDMVGIQGMRGSTKDSATAYDGLYDATLIGVKKLETLFPTKPIMLTDIALSSYPEATYTQKQADNLAKFFTGMPALKEAGVTAMIYRSWLDTPTMDLANYYGEAERHWGLSTATQAKPSAKVWVDGVKAERAGPAPTPTPTPVPAAIPMGAGVTTQVESFTTKQAGGQQSDAAAQGGAMWNLWSNGAVSQSYDFTGAADLTVRARGTPASGVAAHMDVYVAGVKVLAANPASAYADHRVKVTGNGVTEVRIVFTNDVKTTTEDRNLILDAVSLAPANRAPLASFVATSSNLTALVDASASSDPDGDALTYAWTFGDGASGIGAKASHKYATGGSYTVTLTVRDGSLSSVASKSVTAVQQNRAPVASFTAAALDLTVNVDASTSSDADGDALSYSWSFGDGTTDTGRTASKTYTAAGTYAVSLTASDGAVSSTTTQSVTAIQPNRAPAASFTAAASQLTVSLDASASTDADGDALSYAWTFGDGASGNGATASHEYAMGGSYTVTLTVSDGSSSSMASQTVTATQSNRAPIASFVATATGLTVNVDASASTDADGDALSYSWSFGDGTTDAGRTASKTYAAAGTYAVTLSVSDGTVSSTTTQNVTAVPPNRAPAASFTAVVSQLTVNVDASGSSDADGDALVYSWSFGDGTSGTGRTASHAYAATGTYTVTLSVSDGKETVTSSQAVSVIKPYTATFKTNPASSIYWVEEKVTSSPAPAKVEIQVNGGTWQPLKLQNGAWTASMNIAKGTPVVFRATAPDGQTATSATQSWLGAATSTTTTTTTTTAPATNGFKATFTPKSVGNDWLVETAVSANKAVVKVEAKVGSGDWTVLYKTDLGTYANSINAPDGSQVTFRAISSTGAVSYSSPVTWS